MTDETIMQLARRLESLLARPADDDRDSKLAQQAIQDHLSAGGSPLKDLALAGEFSAMMLAALSVGASRSDLFEMCQEMQDQRRARSH